MTTTQPSQLTPEPFGPYTLIRRLGKGGIGEVYLAIAKTTGDERKLLAIKRLLSAYSTESELVSMLADEARLAVWLKHPNIVQVFDFGQISTAHYIAMEFVDGCDLSTLIRGPRGSQLTGQPLPTPTALFILLRIAEALEHAHRCRDDQGRSLKIIHRDVSPHNILLSRTGEVKLTDFGLARTEISGHKTRSGVVRGKFCYMPKEQAHGKAIDHRIDIFAAGVSLYEALTGTRPYSSVNLSQQLYQLEQPVPPPSTCLPSIPRLVDDIVMRAIQPEANQRYQRARELARDLRRVLLTLSSVRTEEAQLAELVQRAIPRPAATVESLPRVSLEELPSPYHSLIADDVMAARRTILVLSQSALQTAYSVEAELDEQPVAVPSDSSASVVEGADDRHIMPPTVSIVKDAHRFQWGSYDAAEQSPEPHIRTTGGTIENNQVLARRRAASTGPEVAGNQANPELPTAGAGSGLVAALRKAQSGGRRSTNEALSALGHALADPRRRPDPEYDHETMFVRPRSTFPITKLVTTVLAVALLGLGLTAGWILRDRQQRSMSERAEATTGIGRSTESIHPLPWPPAATDFHATEPAERAAAPKKALSGAGHRSRSRTHLTTNRGVNETGSGTSTRAGGYRGTVTPIPKGGGMLRIISEKRGKVLINDEPSGITPAKLGLKPGIYRVKLQFDDQSESSVKFVTIDAGSQRQLSF